jgi:predicted dehydrogenase
MKRARVAIVGLGMAVKPHAESLRELVDLVEVAYAFSPSEERRRAFAEQFDFPQTDSLPAILDDASVQTVLLLTPPNTHLELAQKCAAAGKHVLLEKPVEITTERAERLVAICRKAGVTLGINLQHRFRPPALRLKEILASGKLGGLVGASVSVWNWRPQSYYDQPGRGDKLRDGGGVLLTQAIHTLDLFVWLAGMPEAVMGLATTSPIHRMETEDLAGAVLRLPGGAIASVSATTAAYPGFPERIALFCENGSAVIVGTSLHVQYMDGTEERFGAPIGQGGAGADPMAFPNEYHRALISDFLHAIAEERDPAIPGEEALKVHRVIDAILESAQTGGMVRPVIS